MKKAKDNKTEIFLQNVTQLQNVGDFNVFFDKYLSKDARNAMYVAWKKGLELPVTNIKLRKLFLKLNFQNKNSDEVEKNLKKYLSKSDYEKMIDTWYKDFGYFKYLMFNKKLIVLSITHDCNACCSYCKISKGITKASHMKKEDFVKVLDWLEKQNIKLFILTGGEATIHPDFVEMMEILKKRKFQVAFYSNFFFSNKVSKVFSPDLFYRITGHYNPEYENNQKLMNTFFKNVKLVIDSGIEFESRFVLYKKNYERFLDFVQKFNLPFFTLNLVHPSIYNPKKALDEKKITEWRKLVMDFKAETDKRGLKFFISKPVPRCMFTENEFLEFKDKMKLWTTCLDRSQITVKPDLKVSWCNTDLFKPVKNVFDFDDVTDWSRYFWKHVEPLYWQEPSMPKCKSCKYFLNKSCQGACLTFKNVKNVPHSDIFNYNF